MVSWWEEPFDTTDDQEAWDYLVKKTCFTSPEEEKLFLAFIDEWIRDEIVPSGVRQAWWYLIFLNP